MEKFKTASATAAIAGRAADIPPRVTFVHSGTRKSSRVVWRKGRRIGLQF